MRAYGIFAGGGVKGAAFVGCLKAAEEHGITFLGYGGTSAGSIVSLLACVGYSPEELRRIFVNELSFTSLLDEGSEHLDSLHELVTKMEGLQDSPLLGGLSLWNSCSQTLNTLSSKLGIYAGEAFRVFLDKRVREKLRAPPEQPLTFEFLSRTGLPTLQVLASNLQARGPTVYSVQTHPQLSVIDAVRASISFPFVFQPAVIGGVRFVDGGLSANLPLALYQEERRTKNVPVIAFDLVAAPERVANKYGMSNFLRDMAATALESSGSFLRDMVDGVYHIAVPVPEGIETFDLRLDQPKRELLYLRGYERADSGLRRMPQLAVGARTSIQEVQALYVQPLLIDRLLGAVIRDLEEVAEVEDLRANIMFPIADMLKIVYQYGMDDDPDLGIELALDGGGAGFAYTSGEIQVADLADARNHDKRAEWRMTRQQQNQVRRDRGALLSVPLFDSTVQHLEGERKQARAVLNIDMSTPVDRIRLDDPDMGAILDEWQDLFELVLFGK